MHKLLFQPILKCIYPVQCDNANIHYIIWIDLTGTLDSKLWYKYEFWYLSAGFAY